MRITTLNLDALAGTLDEDGSHQHFLDLEDGRLLRHEPGQPLPGSLEKYDVDPERFLALPRLTQEERRDVRERFARGVDEPTSHLLLLHALGGRRALRSFDYELEQRPALRERWQAYRQAQLREYLEHWLRDNGFEPTRSRL